MADSPPPAVRSETSRASWWTRLLRDGRALRSWISARREARRHRRAGTSGRETLEAALRALGERGLDAEPCRGAKGHADALAARLARQQADSAHAAAAQASAQAREALRNADTAARARADELEAQVENASHGVREREREARTSLAELESLRQRKESGVGPETAVMGDRINSLRARMADLGTELTLAQAAHAAAETRAQQESERLAEERKSLARSVDDAQASAKHAGDALAAAGRAEAVALTSLGRAVASSSPAVAGLEAPLAAVRAAERKVAASAEQADTASARAQAAAPGAWRFAWKAGAALVAVVLMIVLLVPARRSPPRAATSAEVADDDLAAHPAPGFAPGEVEAPSALEAAPDAGALLTPAVKAAVRAHPSVEEKREGDVFLQRPVGALRADTGVAAGGGSWRIRIHVDVERRADAQASAQSYEVVVEALVNRFGEPLHVRHIGEVDRELLDLLGD